MSLHLKWNLTIFLKVHWWNFVNFPRLFSEQQQQRIDKEQLSKGHGDIFYSNVNISIFVIFFLINFLVRKSFWLFEFNNEITETASYNIKNTLFVQKKSIKTYYFWRKISERFADCAVEDPLGLETFISLKISLQTKQMFPNSSISNESAVFSPNSSLPKNQQFHLHVDVSTSFSRICSFRISLYFIIFTENFKFITSHFSWYLAVFYQNLMLQRFTNFTDNDVQKSI